MLLTDCKNGINRSGALRLLIERQYFFCLKVLNCLDMFSKTNLIGEWDA